MGVLGLWSQENRLYGRAGVTLSFMDRCYLTTQSQKKTDCMGELQHETRALVFRWLLSCRLAKLLCLQAKCENCNICSHRFQALCCISSISYCVHHSEFDNAAACFWEDHNCQLHPSCLINRKICHSNRKTLSKRRLTGRRCYKTETSLFLN